LKLRVLKEVIWVGSSLNDLKTFSSEVKDEIGFSLYLVQKGKTPQNAKPFHGLGAGVMEIVCDFNTDTYRVVYALKIGKAVYVLHSFQKKSKSGIRTPQKEVDLIRQRLKIAKTIAAKRGS